MKVVELVGEGFVINGATASSFYTDTYINIYIFL